MINSQFTLDGADEVMKALSELPQKVQKQILMSYLRSTAKKFVVDELRLRLPYSRNTEKNIEVQTIRNEPLAVYAGPTTDSYWLRWADKGTKQRKTKDGKNRGSIRAKNQIEATINDQIQPIIDNANTKIGEDINQILEKRIKRVNKINSK